MKSQIQFVYSFALITIFKLAPSLQGDCGEARFVQVNNKSNLYFPWASAIYSLVNRTKNEDAKYICGASVISDKYAVTAAHCMHDKFGDYRRMPAEIILYYGIHDLKQTNLTARAISDIIVHPDWNPRIESYDGDIALVKFMDLITFSSLVNPICLTPDDKVSYSDEGTLITWVDMEPDDPGYWNHQHDPFHIYPTLYKLPIRSNTECFLAQPRFKQISSSRTFCAGGLNSGQCLEVGTSGASMSMLLKERHHLRGIVSASFIDIAGCDNITFTLFTDVTRYKRWIIDSISL